MCGGSFWPGIEVGRNAGMWANWMADWGAQKGHVDVRFVPSNPGELTQTLAIPWQADYAACGGQYWPAGRPESTTRDGITYHDWMADDFDDNIDGEVLIQLWTRLGFIRKVGAQYLETERLPISLSI